MLASLSTRAALMPLLLLGLFLAPGEMRAAQDSVSTLTDIVEREAARRGIPSIAVVVVDRDGTIAEIVHGRLGFEATAAVTPSTLYRTGSVGKTLTDLAVLIGAEEGRLDLDTDVRTYVPEFQPQNPFGEPITLRHLVMHTAGLVREPPIGNYFDASDPSLSATVRSLSGTRLLWKPGSRTKYSNAGLAVVGRALENVYGQPYRDLMGNVVFEPAGMRSAAVGRAGLDSTRIASGLMERPDGTTWPAPTFDLGMAPAGDLYASIRDMGSLMVTLLALDGRVAGPATVKSMWTPSPPRDDWRLEVGFGFSLNGRFAGRYRMARNGGAVYGFATELALLPEEGLGVYAVAAKDLANEVVQGIAHWALLAVLAQRRGEPLPDYESAPIPFRAVSSQLAACSVAADGRADDRLLGTYGPAHNPLIVCRKDGAIHAVVEWMFMYALEERPEGEYAFPSYALYGHETLRFVGQDEHPEVAILGAGPEGVRFERRGRAD